MTRLRTKFVAQNVVDKSDGSPSPFIGLESIESGVGRLNVSELPAKQAEDSLRHRQGDVLFSKLRPYLAKSILARKPGTGTGELLVLRPAEQIDPRYLFYNTLSRPWLDWAEMTSYGSKMPRTSWEAVGDFPLWLPSVEEQRRIADFLDAETARIDALAATVRAVAKKLTERRQSLVFSLVAGRDLQPRSAREGLEWAGELPDCWPTVPLKYAAKIGSGHTPSRTRPEYWENCEIPWISLFDVGKMRNVRHLAMDVTAQNISALGMANSSACLHPAGTVVLSRTASVGFSTIMGQDMAVSQHFVTWTCGDRLLPEYLLYLLRSMTQYFDSVKVGTTNVTVFMPDLHAIKIPLPSVEAQRSIIGEIESDVAVIDSLADAVQGQIDLLAERRQALITAAVTGQFDVTTGRGADLS